ncbi:DMT family transporter [Aliivibrio sp.]|uniref:DMT family transporter n=1 Tax=Aliivibrio sp. TaxID=1872443 RepID=UPI003D2EDC87
MNNLLSSWLYPMFAIIAAISMGAVGTIAKYAQVGSETITFYRLFFGVLFLVLYLWKVNKIALLFKKPSLSLLINGVFLAAFMVFYIQSMIYMNMMMAIMIIYLAPVVAAIFAHLFMNEKLNSAQFIAIVCAFIGFTMVMEFKVSLSGSELKGLLYGLAALTCYSAFILINRTINESIHDFTRSGYQLAVGALCVLPLAWQEMFTINAEQFGWMLLAGLVPGFLGIVLSIIALRKLPAATFGTLAYVEPVSVIALGWVLFNESLSMLQIAGCLVIVMAGLIQAKITINRQLALV